MDNKTVPTEQHFILKEGKLQWIEKMPKHPVKSFEAAHYISAEMEYECAVLEYNEALKSAIDSAVEVSGEVERLIERIKWNIYCENAGFRQPKGFNEIVDTINLEPNKPYSLLCSVEKIRGSRQQNSNLVKVEYALVTFSKPEEKRKELLADLMKTDQEYGMYDQPEEKETPEEWIFKLRDYEVYFGDWYGLPGTSYVKLTRKK